MSNSSDDQPGTRGQGGQPQGGQPQGGTPPQGGQPGQGGQPSAGQPAGGQPQGGYQAGHPPQGGYDAGPGIGDIFSIPETKNELKIGVLLSVLVGVGIAFGILGLATMQTGFGTGFGALSAAATNPVLIVPIVGLYLGVRQADVLKDQPQEVTLGNAAVTTFVGTFLLLLVAMVLGVLILGGSVGNALGSVILPYLIAALGGAAVAAGSGWAVENIVPGPSRTRAHGQQQNQRP